MDLSSRHRFFLIIIIDCFLYSAILHSRADSLMSHIHQVVTDLSSCHRFITMSKICHCCHSLSYCQRFITVVTDLSYSQRFVIVTDLSCCQRFITVTDLSHCHRSVCCYVHLFLLTDAEGEVFEHHRRSREVPQTYVVCLNGPAVRPVVGWSAFLLGLQGRL